MREKSVNRWQIFSYIFSMIGVIDSGSGGVNVIKECLKYFKQDFVYLVDNLNCPYGNKPIEKLKKIVLGNINYLIKNYDIDFIILGCNTASSVLDYYDYEEIKCPIIKTYPDMKSLCKPKGIGLLFATKNTIKNSKYVIYYLKNYNNIQTLYIKDLPKAIDEQITENSTKNNKKTLKKLKKSVFFNKKLKNRYKKVTNIALGCTHFRHIQDDILRLFGDGVGFLYCENNVAKISKLLIKKQTKMPTVKVVLTSPNNKYQKNIENMFNGCLTLPQ